MESIQDRILKRQTVTVGFFHETDEPYEDERRIHQILKEVKLEMLFALSESIKDKMDNAGVTLYGIRVVNQTMRINISDEDNNTFLHTLSVNIAGMAEPTQD